MLDPALRALLSAVITILAASLFIHVAARMVIDRSSFLSALGVAVIATLVATLVAQLLPGPALLGLLVGIVVWAALAAAFYRTKWTKGMIIGIVAWVLWVVVSLAVDFVARRIS